MCRHCLLVTSHVSVRCYCLAKQFGRCADITTVVLRQTVGHHSDRVQGLQIITNSSHVYLTIVRKLMGPVECWSRVNAATVSSLRQTKCHQTVNQHCNLWTFNVSRSTFLLLFPVTAEGQKQYKRVEGCGGLRQGFLVPEVKLIANFCHS